MHTLALIALPFLLLALLVQGLIAGTMWILERVRSRRDRRRARVEAELDRTQAELRATILLLASELGAGAHEARKALIRASYSASGKLPDGL